jgi:hypothetical protein
VLGCSLPIKIGVQDFLISVGWSRPEFLGCGCSDMLREGELLESSVQDGRVLRGVSPLALVPTRWM